MPGNVTLSFGCAVPSTVYVNIDWFIPAYLGCYNTTYFAARASTIVDTAVTVTINWYGDLGGYLSTTTTIGAGTLCAGMSVDTSFYISCSGENLSTSSISISPSSYGTQIYQTGSQDSSGFYPC